MVKPSPEPLIMSRADHVDQIISYWRQRDADDRAFDALFDDQLRAVAFAMAEPEPRPIDKTVAAIWGGYTGFMVLFYGFLLYQMIR